VSNGFHDKEPVRTDVICIFFFLAWWIGMAIIGITAVKKGGYRRLVYGTDYTGEQCNQGPNSGKERMYYPNLEKDLFVWCNSGGTDSFTPGGLRAIGPDSVFMGGPKP
jgi:hypothetical protein